MLWRVPEFDCEVVLWKIFYFSCVIQEILKWFVAYQLDVFAAPHLNFLFFVGGDKQLLVALQPSFLIE
jgi:hypothetical protein